MKKPVVLLSAVMLLGGALFIVNPNKTSRASAEEKDLTPDFLDDFENYTSYESASDAVSAFSTIKEEMGEKWTNCWFDGNDNEGYNSPEHFYVTDNPCKEGNTSEKALLLDGLNLPVINDQNNVWDFYLNTKDYVNGKSYYKVQNGSVEYDYLYANIGDDCYGWSGVHLKKDCENRFDQASGILVCNAANTCGNAFMARGEIPSNGKTTVQFNQTVYGSVTTKTVDFEEEPFEHDSLTWYHAKYTFTTTTNNEGKSSTEFKFYINDTLMGTYVHSTGKAIHDYGFISLNMNNQKIYIDNFKVNNDDVEPWLDPAELIPEVDENTYNYVKGQDLVVNVDFKGQEFVSLKMAATVLAEGTEFVVNENTITIKDSYLSTLKVGTRMFILTTAGGSVQFSVVIKDEEPETSEPDTSEPQTSEEDEPATKKGCGGSIIATSGVIAITSLLGFVFVSSKKKNK